MTDGNNNNAERSDARLKVTGAAVYSAEFKLPQLAYAVLVTSTIASGRVAALDTEDAQQLPGVLLILTHRNAPRLPNAGKAALEPPAGRMLTLLQDDRVFYSGQPIAVVVATSLEQAQTAAQRVRVRYARDTPLLDFAAAMPQARRPEKITAGAPDTTRGDVDTALVQAQQQLRATYTTPTQHHNPLEPHATIAHWQGRQLTLYDSTQYVSGERRVVAKTLGIHIDDVRVICHYVGGGFGCKGSTWSHVLLAAMAARQCGRPVQLALERTQMFGPIGARPRTHQEIRLGADASGRLQALRHDVVAQTSVFEDWMEPCAAVTRMLYDCPNLATTHRLVPLNIGTPTFMRAPGEATGTFALEVALDELAQQLRIDPVELRLRNYAERDPEKNLPFSSKSLRECYRRGAERSGWSQRKAQPRMLRDGRRLIGYGMATATYPTYRSKSMASAQALADGSIVVRSGSQDLGTGTYTILRQIAAEALGVPIERVRVEIGDTRLPEAPVSGGSMTAASVGPAVLAAAQALRAQLIELAISDAASPLHGAARDGIDVEAGMLRRSDGARDPIAALVARRGAPLEATAESAPGDEQKKYSMHAFGAVFAQVAVDEDFGTIELTRITGSYGVGRLLNARTGRSQLLGGIVWGIGMALYEQSELDTRYGRFVNANLAEYHVPVNADVRVIDIDVVDERDTIINPLGAKGIGEIGITGVPAAIANAVFNATGKRVRDLPITLDKLV